LARAARPPGDRASVVALEARLDAAGLALMLFSGWHGYADHCRVFSEAELYQCFGHVVRLSSL
jgi:hypothetical protein